MLQVDLLWVYAIGAMFATAAGKQLKKLDSPFGNIYFASLLFYLSAIFVPEAIWLLWSFPHWETMHVWSSLDEIPTAYVTLFMAGDILLAVLGYWVAAKLILSEREYAAHLQWFAGYFAFFFVLIYGWDGTGWQRFTWDPTVTGSLWEPGKTMGISFATSNVALTLYAMAIPTVLPMLVGSYRWLREGNLVVGIDDRRASSLALRGTGVYVVGVLVSLILAGLASAAAIYTSNLIGSIGSILGIAVVLLLAYLVAFREGGVVHNIILRTFTPRQT
jgi:hypothetical protein